jgi:hypothetical protein
MQKDCKTAVSARCSPFTHPQPVTTACVTLFIIKPQPVRGALRVLRGSEDHRQLVQLLFWRVVMDQCIDGISLGTADQQQPTAETSCAPTLQHNCQTLTLTDGRGTGRGEHTDSLCSRRADRPTTTDGLTLTANCSERKPQPIYTMCTWHAQPQEFRQSANAQAPAHVTCDSWVTVQYSVLAWASALRTAYHHICCWTDVLSRHKAPTGESARNIPC